MKHRTHLLVIVLYKVFRIHTADVGESVNMFFRTSIEKMNTVGLLCVYVHSECTVGHFKSRDVTDFLLQFCE